jgi:hypothetical protein
MAASTTMITADVCGYDSPNRSDQSLVTESYGSDYGNAG